MYFLKSEAEAVKNIIENVRDNKLNQPEQAYKMTMLDKETAEAFQEYCADNGISVNLLETEKGGIKCIYSASDEMKIKAASEKMSDIKNELQNTSIEVKKDDKILMKAVLSELRMQGYKNVFLWVLEENIRARHFYEKLGFMLSDDYLNDNIGGKNLREVRYVYNNGNL